MYPANTYVIRKADDHDEDALRRLAALDSQRPLSGETLIGEVDGRAVAAVSLGDGRSVADPFTATVQLTQMLRLRAAGLRAAKETPSLRDRMRNGVRITGVWTQAKQAA